MILTHKRTPLYLIAIMVAAALGGTFYWRGKHAGRLAGNDPTTIVPPAAPQPASIPTTASTGADQPTDTPTFSGEAALAFTQLQAKYHAGEYVAAVDFADSLLHRGELDTNFMQWLQKQMPTLLISAGWQQIKNSDCDAAAIYLRRAEAVAKNAEISKGLAYCYHKLKNVLAADEQFRTYLDQRPDDLHMHLLYADHLESDRRYQAAEKILRQIANDTTTTADDNNIDREQIAKRAEAMRAKASEDNLQTSISSEHIQIIYRPEEHGVVVNPILDVLENAISEYEDHLGIPPPRSPIEVILYPSDGFSRFAAGAPDWAQGIFDGRIRIPISRAALRQHGFRELNKVLRHELFHALMANQTNGRNLPPWFNEGMAQRLECPVTAPCSVKMPLTPGQFLPEHVFFVPYTTFDELLASRTYMQSRYLIATIEQEHEGLESLRQIIATLPTSGEINSNKLLLPLRTNFAQLHARAAYLWRRR